MAVKVMSYCKRAGKPLIIENLDFERKKYEMKMYDSNKKYNKMLSEFSYRSIIEKLYSRGYKERIGINEVNPAYTSVIGEIKYAKRRSLNIHTAASYVIGRRGMGYRERLAKREYGNIDKPLELRWKLYAKEVLR